MLNKKFSIFLILASVSAGIFYYVIKPNESIASAKEGKTFGDWKIICEKESEKSKKEICYAQQIITIKQEEKLIPVATYQLRYNKKEGLKLVEILPQNILLQPGTSVILKDKLILPGIFTTCREGACVAVANVSDKDINDLAKQDSASIGFMDISGKQINLTISVKGIKSAVKHIKK